MDYIDVQAQLAVLEAVSAVFEESPEGLSRAERLARIEATLAKGRRDLDCFIPAEADEAYRQALAAVQAEVFTDKWLNFALGELNPSDAGGFAEISNKYRDFGLSPQAAAKLLADKRRTGQ